MDDLSFGLWLQRRRRALLLTQADLGRRVGVAAATIRKIEADERRPSAQVAERLAEALAIPASDRAPFVRAARGAQIDAESLATDHDAATATLLPSASVVEEPLPAPLTPLIGRAAIVAAICDRLAHPEVRLLTLAGPGGVGKTRVALQVAAALRASRPTTFADGVMFVPLASVPAPALVEAAIGAALGLRDRGDRPAIDQLRAALRGRQMLLILDNFEHLTAAGPHLVALLRGAPGLHLLVTSRVVLRVGGEEIITVPPLALPGLGSERSDPAGSPATQLFQDRASASAPGLSWGAEDLAAAAEICTLLDGLPLAIELAAARSRLLSPEELLAQLRSRPFEALAGGPRDLPVRQQALRATLDWSFDLLGDRERALFVGLGLFAGGFTLDLARKALGAELATLDALAALVDHSLIAAAPGRPGERRFAMLELVRLYALERLAESRSAEAARAGWAGTLLDLAEAAGRGLHAQHQGDWLDRLDAERPNIGALLAWALGEQAASGPPADARAAIGARLVAAMAPFWWRRGYAGEGQRWMAAALPLAGRVAADVRARLLAQAGRLAWHQGEHALALARSEDALALSQSIGDTRSAAHALLTLGTVRWYEGEGQIAERYLVEGLALAEVDGELHLQAEICLVLALLAYNRADHVRQVRMLERSLSTSRALGDSLGVAEALLWFGNIAVERGALEQAEPPYREALGRYVALRDRDGEARVLHKLADLAHDQGDLLAARARFDACLAIRRAIGDHAGIAVALIGLGDVLLRQGQLDRAGGCYGEALLLGQARGDHVDRAWAIRGQARVARARGELAAARQLFAESLRLAWAQANPWGIAVCLDGLGGAVAALGDDHLAAVLFGAADRVREINQLRVVPGAIPDADQDRAAVRERLGVTAFDTARALAMARPVEALIAEVEG